MAIKRLLIKSLLNDESVSFSAAAAASVKLFAADLMILTETALKKPPAAQIHCYNDHYHSLWV